MKPQNIDISNVVVVSTIVLLCLSTTMSMGFPTLALMAFLPFCLLKPTWFIPLFFIASLSSDYFSATEGIGLTRCYGIAIFVAVTIQIILKKRLLQKKWLALILLIVATTLISYRFSYDPSGPQYLTMGLNLLIFFALAHMDLAAKDVHKIGRQILLVAIITSVFICFQAIMNPMIVSYGRQSIAMDVNENRFAMMMAQLAMCLFAGTKIYPQFWQKAGCFILMAGNVYLILLAGSRSALIGVTMGVLMGSVILMSGRQKLSKSLVVAVLAIGVGVVIFDYVVAIKPQIAARMNVANVVATGGTRRWPRLVNELQYVIPNHLFFGVGLAAMNEKLALLPYMADSGSSHNFLVSMLTQVGSVGAAIYLKTVYAVWREVYRGLQAQMILCLPLFLLLGAIFNGVGEVIYLERLFWNALALGVLFANALKKE